MSGAVIVVPLDVDFVPHERQAKPQCLPFLRDELDDATSLLQLGLGQAGHEAGADDNRDGRDAALAQKLGVAQGQQVDNGQDVGVGVGQVLLALLLRDERPELGGSELASCL